MRRSQLKAIIKECIAEEMMNEAEAPSFEFKRAGTLYKGLIDFVEAHKKNGEKVPRKVLNAITTVQDYLFNWDV